jgi:exodeoxyribonuclease VII large subunit
MRTLFDAPAITVGELCRQIKGALESAFPTAVRVAGEVSKCTVAPSGHAYFSLKDADGLVQCVCWKTTVRSLDIAFPIADGTAVEVVGRVTAYKERSQFQIVVDDVVPTGRGELHRRYELLKEKLRREGLFDEERKRAIPSFVSSVAIVTSRGAAALQDFLTTCKRRGAHVSVTLVHAPVQGDAAIRPLAAAIAFAGTLPVDVVVVARGGGSIEDLWAFNTEPVARAIAACARPVISAIGHETDVTIADLVADRRAATPTAAAEMVSPDRRKLLEEIAARERRLRRSLARIASEAGRRFRAVSEALADAPQTLLGAAAQVVDGLDERLRFADPRRRVAGFEQRVGSARQRLSAAAARAFIAAFESIRLWEERRRLAFAKALVARQSAIDVAAARLSALGPSATLGRGYAIVFGARGAVLTDAARTARGESLDITLKRGRVRAAVTQTEVGSGEDRFEEKA